MLATSDWQALCVHTMDDMLACITRLTAEMRDAGFAAQELFGGRMALEEALVNAIRHGHKGDTTKRVDIRFQINERQLLVEIQDEGRGFDPEGVPDPRAPENLERAGGRGVFLMRHYMSWVQFNEAGNCVTLCKLKSAACRK